MDIIDNIDNIKKINNKDNMNYKGKRDTSAKWPKLSRIIKIIIILAIIIFPIGFWKIATNTINIDNEKHVLAFYYTWYGNTTAYDGEEPDWATNWLHWNENNHNPPFTIAANHTPILGAFDSADNNTIKKHISWAKRAGIDSFIATWWGYDSPENVKFEKLLRYSTDNKLDFQFTVYFESVQQRFKENASEIYEHMKYICENYGNRPNFLNIDGRPVIFIYAISAVPDENWQIAREMLKNDGLNPYLVADLGRPRAPKQWEINVFDAFHIYNPAGYIRDEENYSPDFEEMILQSHFAGRQAYYTVIPGYNDFAVCHCGDPDGRNTYFDVPRNNGELYNKMWKDATNSNADWILICTFNEWHEGSEIEPSTEFGDYYINITTQWAKSWKNH